MHLMIKGILVFFAGAVLALGLLFVISGGNKQLSQQNPGESFVKSFSNEQVRRETAERMVETMTNFVEEKVAGAIEENPIIQPVKQTKEDVQKAIDSITSLPSQQREVICKQICQP